MSIEPKVLTSLWEQTVNQNACSRCGALVEWNNHLTDQPADCGRCHKYGRLFDRGCRGRNCQRERSIDSGWRETGWPR